MIENSLAAFLVFSFSCVSFALGISISGGLMDYLIKRRDCLHKERLAEIDAKIRLIGAQEERTK